GKNLIRSFHDLGALRIICDTDLEVLNNYSHTYRGVEITSSFEEVLTNPSVTAIAIATPAATHFAIAKEALNSGKHVFVEKPLRLRREEGQEVVALAESRKQVLMVGHILQYHPAVRKIKDLVTNGYVGKLQYIYSNRLNIGKVRSEENILWSFAPHDISVM